MRARNECLDQALNNQDGGQDEHDEASCLQLVCRTEDGEDATCIQVCSLLFVVGDATTVAHSHAHRFASPSVSRTSKANGAGGTPVGRLTAGERSPE